MAAQAQTQKKVLRIGIVQDGKIVQERLIKSGESVSVGESTRNTFVFPPTSLPKRYTLFHCKGGRYTLHISEEMKGKVAYKDAIVGLPQLRARGDTLRKGNVWHLPLGEGNRGKVSIKNITILFQFVPPPPEPITAIKREDFRPRLIEEDDPVFLGFLGLFTALACVIGIYVANAEPVERIDLSTIPERFTHIVLEPELDDIPEPELDEEGEGTEVAAEEEEAAASEGGEEDEAEEEAGGEEEEQAPLTEAEQAAAEEARQAALEAQAIEESPLLAALIATRGEGGGSTDDPYGQGDAVGQNLDQALSTVTGVQASTAEKAAAREGKGGGGRGDADIGDLAQAKGGSGELATGPKTEVKGSVKTGSADLDFVEGDTDAVVKVVRKYTGQIKYCYERRLKENPGVAGRVEVQWTITDGRVTSASLFANTTGDDELGSCIISKIKKWRFPSDQVEGEVIYPFVLTPG